ncbi:hypothetical protein LTR85_000553 [Meristemomyces frigidus]|nr:hypothetical protein LTR85_000553 [Meristemomyces frigidus]
MKLESEERAALANTPDNVDHGDVGHMQPISDVEPATGNSPVKRRAGVIRPLARLLLSLSNYIGNPAHKRFDDSEFKRGEATGYPQIPGERGRNPSLVRIETQWTDRRGSDRSVTPAARSQRSRACSCNGSVASKIAAEHREGSPQRPEGASPRRRDTLELPSPVRPSRPQDISILERTDTVTSAGSLVTPAIVVSSTGDDSCNTDADASDSRLQASTPPPD